MSNQEKKELTTRQLLKMLIEWCNCTEEYHGDYNAWWAKYPQYSHHDVIELAKKKLNQTQSPNNSSVNKQ